ncbi:MAG: FmdB family zinc ribbon protein [Vicinamibacterales bacterium]
MPLYEYQCDACGGRIERIRKFSDPPLEDPCPSCGGHLTKLLSSPAIQFKGAGWYVNDYAKSGSSSAGSSSKSGESKSETADKKDTPAASEKSDTKSTSTEK